MAKLRPYLALDIETTGLDVEKSQVLQIGWVIDDGISPVGSLERGSVIVKRKTISYGEPYALAMNQWLFQQMEMKTPKYPVKNFLRAFYEDLQKAVLTTSKLAYDFDVANGEKRPSERVQIAGKNAGSFDWPIIINNWKAKEFPSHHNLEELGQFQKKVDHRFIDVGGAFFDTFGKNPGFDQINKLIQYKDITHDALDDALNVVVALRYRMGMNF